MDKKEHKELLVYLLNQTRKHFPKKDDGHGEDHLLRVLKSAMLLREQLGGDEIVIICAAILHDIHRWLNVSPIQSLDRVSDIISPLPLTAPQNQQILFAIRDHELYENNGYSFFLLKRKLFRMQIDSMRLEPLELCGFFSMDLHTEFHITQQELI